MPKDPYTAHWAHDTPLVSNNTKEELEALKFRKSAKGVFNMPGLGRVSELTPAVSGMEADGPVAGEGMGIVSDFSFQRQERCCFPLLSLL